VTLKIFIFFGEIFFFEKEILKNFSLKQKNVQRMVLFSLTSIEKEEDLGKMAMA